MRAVYKLLLGLGLSSCATALLSSPVSPPAPPACERPVYLTFDTGHMQVAPFVAEVLVGIRFGRPFFWQTSRHVLAAQAWMRFGRRGGGRWQGKAMPLAHIPLTTCIG